LAVDESAGLIDTIFYPVMKFEQRAMAFMSAMMCFLGLFAVLRVRKGLSFLPNFEWILPTLIVLGSLFPFEFGILALVFVQVLWTLLYGPKPIQIFTCSGFALVWFLARKRYLSPFGSLRKLIGQSLLTSAAGILLYDFWTGVLGWSLLGQASLYTSLLGQIPFTIYHLSSLVFVPPLVTLAKLTVRTKIPIVVPVPARTKVRMR
jgi:hypothetical protein